MKRSMLCIIAIFMCSGLTAVMKEENYMLRSMAAWMHVYYLSHHRYPRDWLELHRKPVCVESSISAEYPRQEQKYVFRPTGCKYTYKYISENSDHFQIIQYNADDAIVGKIDQSVKVNIIDPMTLH